MKQAIEPSAIYSKNETCELLGISTLTFQKLVAQGHLKVSKPDRRIMVLGQWIIDFLHKTEKRDV